MKERRKHSSICSETICPAMKYTINILLALVSCGLPVRHTANVNQLGGCDIRSTIGAKSPPSSKNILCLHSHGCSNRLHSKWEDGKSSVDQGRNVLRLRGGFQRKVVFEGQLRKFQASSNSWCPLRSVLDDSALMCYRTPENGKLADQPDEDLGHVPLDQAEFFPVDAMSRSSAPSTDKNVLGDDRSVIEVRLSGHRTGFYIAARTPEERNKWLLAMYQNKALLIHRRAQAQNALTTRGFISGQLDWMYASVRLVSGISVMGCLGQLQRFMPRVSMGVGTGAGAGTRPPAAAPSPLYLVANKDNDIGQQGGTIETHGLHAGINASVQAELVADEPQLERLRNMSQMARDVEAGEEALLNSNQTMVPITTNSTPHKPDSLQENLMPAAMQAAAHDSLQVSINVTAGNATLQQQLQQPGSAFGETTTVRSAENHTATVVWLHGMGDSGDYFEALPETLGVPWCRFVFPTAATQPVAIHQGIRQPAWFDVTK